MRKRSGAIDSQNLEAYVKLATLSQNKESILYTNDYIMVENYEMSEETLKRTTSRKWSDIPMTKNNVKMHSIPTASSSVKFRKNANFDISCSSKENNYDKRTFEDTGRTSEDTLNCGRTYSNFSSVSNDEISMNPVNRKVTKQIIVIGSSQTGKKSLVHSLFGEGEEDPFLSNEVSSKEPCFDLIVKSEDVLQNEKYIYKFWIQNLSNEIYDKIIDVYYKTMNLFIFVYNVSDRKSFYKIKEHYEHIKLMSKTGNLNCLLIGMHFSPKHKIDVSYEEANQFAEEMNFLGFLVTNSKNSAVNKNIYEIIRSHFGISGERKEDT